MTGLQRAVSRWRGASLRRRLLLWLLPAACVIGLLASAGTYWGALRELDDLLDDQMRSMSKQIVVGPNGELSFRSHAEGEHDFKVNDPDAVLLQVWRNGALVYSTDRVSKLPPPPPSQTGIASVDVDGQPWRTYVTQRGGTTIRVAQARHARWEAIAGIAVHLLWPVFSMLPVLAIGLWFGIGAGLRPLRTIASGLKRRNATNLEPVDVASMPNEVRPLAEAINDLLARLDRSFTLQRHFIADAAHELRTPIMGLSIQTQLLRRAATPDERERILAQIHAGTTRLGHLAEQLLTLARLEPDAQKAAFAPVDLAALCRSVVAERARVADAHHVDLGAIPGPAVVVPGNIDTLRVLLNNLVDNAIRYAGEGARVDVGARIDGTTPVLDVSDNGPGIPEAERASVWERFYRGAGAQTATSSGSGLGLSIVQRIAEQHRATVALDTSPGGRGLTVTVRFRAPV